MGAGKKSPSKTDRLLIMMEHLQDQVKALAEGQIALRDDVREQIAALRKELVARIEVLEQIAREHSAILRQHSAELRAIREEMVKLATRAELEALERRVAALEARVGM